MFKTGNCMLIVVVSWLRVALGTVIINGLVTFRLPHKLRQHLRAYLIRPRIPARLCYTKLRSVAKNTSKHGNSFEMTSSKYVYILSEAETASAC